ncbi:valacyclovir hydrolase [Culex quinquefasciatus]|uniref:valacyclovir hydrolase n=1 Tax=Culex quinquefasciatus TaxID=7176 RepID=UPI0018E2A739|nr:valacyclovir hydrolase [Culex quinquefasciatus]XP_038116239.1 valacyclovir hydrolase [Culex quinquefasciatus]XP_038116240.1 valacyclovir hydrolase [Culex quinquefasciatus]
MQLLKLCSSASKLLTGATTGRALIARTLASNPAPMERLLQVGQQRINIVEAGTGDRGVLLMPGALGSAWTDFKPQIEQLPALLPNHRIVAWDPPGYGKSRPPNKTFGLDFYEKDAEAAAQLMEAVGLKRFSVLGWSDGGITGLVLAGTKPDVVEKLVIWGANAYITKPEAEIYEGVRDVSKWSARMREPMEKVYGKEGFPQIWSAWVDGMLNLYRKRDGDICKGVLANIRAPTFIVHGAKDPMIVPEHVPYLKEAVKSTELVHVFPDGKHNIHLKYAEEFNKLVSDFLRK